MKRNTKSALLLSIASIIMCCVMLMGTTMAWFTDSVTSKTNIIKAGNLDVEMYWADGTEAPTSATWTDASTGAIFDYDLWEPGYTEVRHIKISNVGTLALKYQIEIIANGTVSDLADVIDVYYVDPAVQVADRSALTDDYKLGTLTKALAGIATTASGNLEADASHTITIALKMQESAGNEYMDKSIGTDFSVRLLATQYTLEEDSFDENYDAEATYPAFPVPEDTWDGTADISWYNETDTEFVLDTAEQLAGMSQLIADGNTFAGKTIKLSTNVDMSAEEWKVANKDFSGTFDGQGYTIYNIHRKDESYTGGRIGLFGHVESGTVKNVIIDGAEFYGYGPYGAVVAGSAYGDCVFENITLKNCTNEMYNTGSAGIVGLAYSDSNYTFKGINIDSSNSIGGYWGTYDIAAGGLIGYFWKNGDALSPVLVEDCYLAQQMNVYNDVCANYQWYAYRYSGMLIGYVNGSTTNVDGTTYPLADTVTCNNVTVEYGDWTNYYYCELESNGHPSYAGENDYKFSRLVPISSVDEISSEEYAWDNHFVLIDGDNVTCYHVTRNSDTREITGYHTHTEAEDNVCVKLTFDQLFGGGQGVYGDKDHDGVTVIYK